MLYFYRLLGGFAVKMIGTNFLLSEADAGQQQGKHSQLQTFFIDHPSRTALRRGELRPLTRKFAMTGSAARDYCSELEITFESLSNQSNVGYVVGDGKFPVVVGRFREV